MRLSQTTSHVPLPLLPLLLPLLLPRLATAASSTAPSELPICTASSSSGSGAYFDLRPDRAVAPAKGKSNTGPVAKDYFSRGYDYGVNFTMNICGPVVHPVQDVVGLKESQWASVGAYYIDDDEVYSIGEPSTALQSRGRKLILQYTNGSPCSTSTSTSTSTSSSSGSGGGARDSKGPTRVGRDGLSYVAHGGDLATLDEKRAVATTRRKSATISFLCDHDAANSQASVSFVGADPEQCAYFFEARSFHACAQAEPHKPGSVGPGSIFSLILLIAVLVYVLGGVFYNRTVAHARGWRQLPNFSLWAGIWSFISDMFIIITSSCTRFLPGRRGYNQLRTSPNRRDARSSEAENRLIDQLDEEWED